MMLCDTSVIIAVLNVRDRNNRVCLDALSNAIPPLVTTWPCITEALYLLHAQAGSSVQEKLLQQIEHRVYGLAELTIENALRACRLMRQYADAPMDFADASLVVAAETLGVTRILTLDSHFYAYLINGKTSFEVLPV